MTMSIQRTRFNANLENNKNKEKEIFSNVKQAQRNKSEQSNKYSKALNDPDLERFLEKYPVFIMNPEDDYKFEEDDVLYWIGTIDRPEIEEYIIDALNNNKGKVLFLLFNFTILEKMASKEKNFRTLSIRTERTRSQVRYQNNFDKIINNLEKRLRDESIIKREIKTLQHEIDELERSANVAKNPSKRKLLKVLKP